MSRFSLSSPLLAVLFAPTVLFLACEEEKAVEEINNFPPFSPVIDLQPHDPSTIDPLVVTIITSSEDPENGPIDDGDLLYRWYLDDVLSDVSAEATLPAEATTKGDSWEVEVVATDGSLESAPSRWSVTISNTKPMMDSGYGISPADPDARDDIVASVSATDADNDEVVFDYEWTVDGELAEYEGLIVNGDTISSEITAKGQAWELSVTPNDGDANGESVSIAWTIGNIEPVVTAVSIAPDPASEVL
jgi:hypothetical protein